MYLLNVLTRTLYGFRSGVGAPYLWVARAPSYLSKALYLPAVQSRESSS
jgi:hypothetical protein